MDLLLAFAGVLLLAVLVSERASRSILSTAVLFLVAGFVLGPGVLGALEVGGESGRSMVSHVAELALFAVLFTDGMRIGVRQLASAWGLPGRALLLGLPLTLVLTALVAVGVAEVGWGQALLLGAVLAPTDPVFASALVGREEVPARLRHLLNVESGINDGLALPFVLVFVAILGGQDTTAGTLAGELSAGIVLGVVVPWVAIRLEGSRWLAATTRYAPLSGVAIALLVFALAKATHANLFLAAFAAGVTVASASTSLTRAFHEIGELASELLKLFALLVFGALLSPGFLAEIPVSGYVFAAVALLLVRPLALTIALARSPLTRAEVVAASWFGPKGFASVVYALVVLDSGVPGADELYHLAAVVIAASMIAHSSTDVAVAHWFARAQEEAEVEASAQEREEWREADAVASRAEAEIEG